jgi:hypothetical protein
MIPARPLCLVLDILKRMIGERRQKLTIMETELDTQRKLWFEQKDFFADFLPLYNYVQENVYRLKIEISELISCYTLLDTKYRQLLEGGASKIGIRGEPGDIGSATLEWVVTKFLQKERIHICHLCWLEALSLH